MKEETFTHGHIEGGTIYGEVPEWDIENNPKALAEKYIQIQTKVEDARKAGFTRAQIDFMFKHGLL